MCVPQSCKYRRLKEVQMENSNHCSFLSFGFRVEIVILLIIMSELDTFVMLKYPIGSSVGIITAMH